MSDIVRSHIHCSMIQYLHYSHCRAHLWDIKRSVHCSRKGENELLWKSVRWPGAGMSRARSCADVYTCTLSFFPFQIHIPSSVQCRRAPVPSVIAPVHERFQCFVHIPHRLIVLLLPDPDLSLLDVSRPVIAPPGYKYLNLKELAADIIIIIITGIFRVA